MGHVTAGKSLRSSFSRTVPMDGSPPRCSGVAIKHFSLVSTRGLASTHVRTAPAPAFLPQRLGSERNLRFTLHLECTRREWTQVSYCTPSIASPPCLVFLFDGRSIHKAHALWSWQKVLGRLGNNPVRFFESKPENQKFKTLTLLFQSDSIYNRGKWYEKNANIHGLNLNFWTNFPLTILKTSVVYRRYKSGQN